MQKEVEQRRHCALGERKDVLSHKL
jgi:hypothetical protein